VTSAWHLPPSMAEFEAVSGKITTCPVGLSHRDCTLLNEYSLANNLVSW